jgi:TfoX N-terminal domain
MAYDEGVAQRLREALGARRDIAEKKMFGGLAFMLSGNMCCGVIGDTLMARVGPRQYDKALARKHARAMDFTGKPLKGFVYVAPAGFASDRDLERWVSLCVAFAGSLPRKKAVRTR